jgi:hypothetical protein
MQTGYAEKVQWAAAMMIAATEHDASLTVTDAARYVGEWPGSEADMARAAARVEGRDENHAGIISIQHKDALLEEKEFQKGVDLAVWLEDELTDEERGRVRLAPQYLDDECLTPYDLVTGEGASEKRFSLGQSFVFHTPVSHQKSDISDRVRADLRRPDLTMLPPDIQTTLRQKQEVLKAQGVENGAELERFLEENFDIIEVNLAAGDKLPLELRRITATMAGAEDVFATAGVVRLRRLKRVPEIVMCKIDSITRTQHLMRLCLEGLVKNDQKPKFLEADYARAQEVCEADAELLKDKLGPPRHFERDLLLTLASQKARQDSDLDSAVDSIRSFSDMAVGVQITIPEDADAETRSWLEQSGSIINKELDDDFGRDTALTHIKRSLAEEDAKDIKKSLKFSVGLIALGVGLEVVGDNWWEPALTLAVLTGLAEDPVSEIGEIASWLRRGQSISQMGERLAVVGGAGAGSLCLGTQVRSIAENHGLGWAGLAFMVAACVTSIATQFENLRTGAKAYRKLAAEGKLPRQIAIAANASMPAPAAAEPHAIDSSVRAFSRASDATEIGEIMDAEIRTLAEQELVVVSPNVRVTWLEAYGAAWKDAMTGNYPRIGKLLGAAVMVGIGWPFGQLLNSFPALSTPAGMGEPVGGLSVDALMSKSYDARRQRKMRSDLRRIIRQGITASRALPPRPGTEIVEPVS